MKQTKTAVLAAGSALFLAGGAAHAEDLGGGISVSSEVAFTSNYIYRGFTENDEEPAIQGSLDFAHESGLYLGAWGTSGAVDAGFGVEIDVYGGYTFAVTDGVWGDVGFLHYNYPEDSDINTNELYAGVGTAFGDVEADLYVFGSDDYVGTDESSVYVETNWMAPIAAGFYGVARAGYLDIDVDGFEGYDWGVGAGYEYRSLDLNVLVVDQEEQDDTQVAVTLGRAF